MLSAINIYTKSSKGMEKNIHCMAASRKGNCRPQKIIAEVTQNGTKNMLLKIFTGL